MIAELLGIFLLAAVAGAATLLWVCLAMGAWALFREGWND